MKGIKKMVAINLDEKLNVQNKVDLTIAGKEYSVILNDDLGKAITNTLLEIDDKTESLRNDQSLEELAESSLDKQKAAVSKVLDDVRDAEIGIFDRLLGENEGKRIYRYYNKSTQALTFLLAELQKVYKKSITLKKEKQNKKKRQKYIKK